MINSLKVAALTAFTLAAAGSVAQATPHGKHHTAGSGSQQHASVHPQKHNTSPSHGPSKKVVITHCDPGPCTGHHPSHPGKVVEHHKHHHWHPHRYHAGYRYGYSREQYAPYRQPSYAPQPNYATYTRAPAAPVPAASCLTKEYLANGPVLFKDTCTKEWAMGDAAPTRFVNAGCLRKDYFDGNKVKFTDTCTREWAMNAPADQAAAPAPSQQASAATPEEDDED